MVSGLGGGLVSGFGFVFGGVRVVSFTRVADISDITVVVVSGVGHGLGTTIGKSDGVGSRDSLGVRGFLGVEVGSGVRISNSVLESVGFGFFFVGGFMVSGGGLVSNRGWGISGCSLHNHGGNNRSVMDGMVDNWVNSMMGNWMNRMMSHWVDSVMDWSVVEHMLDSSVGGSQGENSSSNKSLKH